MLHKIVKMKDGWYVKVPYFFNKADLQRSRFDPITIGIAMMAGGAGLSAYSTIQGGKEAAKMGKLQQQQYEAEAQAVVMAGAEESRLKREEGRRLLASKIAVVSASREGLVGSKLVIMAELARNVEMDANIIERNAQIRARALRTQGAFARYEGQMARKTARIRAFANILGTAGQSYLTYKSYKGSSGGYKAPSGMSTTSSGAPYLTEAQLLA